MCGNPSGQCGHPRETLRLNRIDLLPMAMAVFPVPG